jgi:hypothetical protein
MGLKTGNIVIVVDNDEKYYNKVGIVLWNGYAHCSVLFTDGMKQLLRYESLRIAGLPQLVSNCDFSDKTAIWDSKGEYVSILDRLTTYPPEKEIQKITNLPTRVLFNDKKKATTLLFKDKPTVVKAREDDKYDRRIGFLEAYFQATSGLSKTKALKYLNDIVKDKIIEKKPQPQSKPKKKKNKEDLYHLENGKTITLKDMVKEVSEIKGNFNEEDCCKNETNEK